MEIFDEYKKIRSKFEGSFLVVIYGLKCDELIDKISHRINLVNTINDRVKKNYLLSRMVNFHDYISARYDNNNNNSIWGIFLVHDTVDYFAINNEWKKSIEAFDVDNFIFKFNEYFDIDYLVDLLTNNNYYDVVNVSQNRFVHYYCTKSKRKNIHSGENNYNDLNTYLTKYNQEQKTQNNNNNNNVLIRKIPHMLLHGNSHILKNFVESDNLGIHSKGSLNQEEITEYFEKKENIFAMKELENWINNLLNPNLGHRILFGKDITKAITNGMIKQIYCTPEMEKKIRDKIPPELQKFEITVVKTYGIDMGKRLRDEFSGIIGITYF